MIELKNDTLVFAFPEVHPQAKFHVDLQRTLRIPDDGKDYPLPPGLGSFPLRHVDDFGERAPRTWIERGGVMLPMYQAEALWLNFKSTLVDDRSLYPFLVKIATGKINAVTGEEWADAVHRDPQDYLVVPAQPWLDGYCVEKGLVRQFVAMPLGAGYSAEEQLTGAARWGGVQICAWPMKREAFERRFPKRRREVRPSSEEVWGSLCGAPPLDSQTTRGGMGLAPGGRMRQEIYDDPFDFSDWDLRQRSRCFVHLANSQLWRTITGEEPPPTPITAAFYERRGLPWFDYYGEVPAVSGSERLKGMKSVAELGAEKGDVPLPENESVDPSRVVKLGKRGPAQVREW